MAIPTLSLDIGNTAVKWRLRRGRAVNQGRVLHHAQCVEAILAALGDRPQGPWQLAYSAVAHPQKVARVVRPLERLLQTSGHRLVAKRRLVCAGPSSALEVTCSYTEPAELGADRWAAVLGVTRQIARIRRAQAAQLAHPVPGGQAHLPSALRGGGISAPRAFSLWLVSAGTATVIDLVEVGLNAENRLVRLGFLGGCILPGIGLTREALAQATGALAAHMPESTVRFRIQGLPRNSRDAIGYGLAAAQSSALLALPRPAGVIVHGGYAKDWLRYFQAVFVANMPQERRELDLFFLQSPHLVLDGVEQWASATRLQGPTGG